MCTVGSDDGKAMIQNLYSSLKLYVSMKCFQSHINCSFTVDNLSYNLLSAQATIPDYKEEVTYVLYVIFVPLNLLNSPALLLKQSV
jgi:hypothetical protein